MKSWKRWGRRAVTLAMLLSLLMAPVSAIARGGHNNGDETQDQFEPVGELLVGDPDTPGNGRTPRSPGVGASSPTAEINPIDGGSTELRLLIRQLLMLLATGGWRGTVR